MVRQLPARDLAAKGETANQEEDNTDDDSGYFKFKLALFSPFFWCAITWYRLGQPLGDERQELRTLKGRRYGYENPYRPAALYSSPAHGNVAERPQQFRFTSSALAGDANRRASRT
jgi:hypothetical protein